MLRVFIELEGMYCSMVEQLVIYAVRNEIKDFVKLEVLRYEEMKNL